MQELLGVKNLEQSQTYGERLWVNKLYLYSILFLYYWIRGESLENLTYRVNLLDHNLWNEFMKFKLWSKFTSLKGPDVPFALIIYYFHISKYFVDNWWRKKMEMAFELYDK